MCVNKRWRAPHPLIRPIIECGWVIGLSMQWPSKAKAIQGRKGPLEGMKFTAIIKLALHLLYDVLSLLFEVYVHNNL
jgi:hypothetical protein